MSEIDGSNVDTQIPPVESNQLEEKQFVAKKAYEDVSKDMHKYKSRNKEIEARANQLEAELNSIKEQKLVEQNRFQELYEEQKVANTDLINARQKDRDLYLRSVKLSALKQELGGKVKDVYLNHADLDNIEISEDGSLSSESLLVVANKFRTEFPEVIPSTENKNITGNASPTKIAIDGNEEIDINKMTFEQKAQMLQDIKNNRR